MRRAATAVLVAALHVATGARADAGANAVEPSEPGDLTYDRFIAAVMEENLDYAAQRYNIEVAKAESAAARLLPNPSLQWSGDRDLSYHDAHGVGSDGERTLLRQVESHGAGLTETVPLGGKRKWRIRAAEASYRATSATVDDFLRNLKVDASEAFVAALSTQATAEQQRIAAGYLADLRRAQEVRFNAGGISDVDLAETRLEELQFRDELLKAEVAAEQARLALAKFLGREFGEANFTVRGHLDQPHASYELRALIDRALSERPDLVALRHALDAAESNVKLARSKSIPDLDVGVTYTDNSPVAATHPIDPTPGFHQLELALTVTLPIFDYGQHDVAIARAQAEQARALLEAAEIKVEVEARTADAQYRTALERVSTFRSDLIKSATSVLEAKRYSYQRGGSTLLELLVAQRAANEVEQAYQEALADVATALLELQRATTVGDVDFLP